MTSVAVAVNGRPGGCGGKDSLRAVKWAVENLMEEAHHFVLIHVVPTITSIPSPSGHPIPVKELDANVVTMYLYEMKVKFEEIFVPYKKLCKTGEMETLVLEGDNPAAALIRYISDSRITYLVLGSWSSNFITRKIKGPGIPSTVLKDAPGTCTIYVVSKDNLITNSVNALSTSGRSSKIWLFSQNKHGSFRIKKLPAGHYSSYVESKDFDMIGASSVTDYSDSQSQALPHGSSHDYSFPVQQGNYHTTEHGVADTHKTEAERLRTELRNTVAMYNQACENLVHAQAKIHLISSDCLEESKRVNAALKREETFRKIAAEEKEKHLEAVKEIEIARNLLTKEGYEREIAELNYLKESVEKQKIAHALFLSDKRYKKYTREEIKMATDNFSENNLIGEGAYGKVYTCKLDHIQVAIKVLRPGADKKHEFLKEVEVLSKLRHPHMVLLLGACPEDGCLVYEFMEKGNLEDHIFRRSGRQSLPWSIRFRIAFEIACGLAFLHNSKPDPIIHCDLKPGNILLDKNYVSKIGDVGLAKLISDVVPDNITEYGDSIIAGTLFYMDPEYQRTGTIRPKSDVYAFGIITLQLLAACRPKGLLLRVEDALENGSIYEILDKSANQICAKAVVAQMMIIVFARVEADSMVVQFRNVSVGELLEFSDRNLNEGSSIQFAQHFVNETVQMFNEGRFPSDSMQSTAEQKKGDESVEEGDSPGSLSDYTKIREDGLMLFKNLCKLSMKFSSQEQPDDQILLRGKTLSLELLKVIMDSAGSIWRTNERFLNNIKQYLCLSLLKNSALSVMNVFQLLCSIFENFLTKFRSGLKSEIGIFFPMLILRVLENVLQPSFLQKMTILNLLEKISQDPEIVIDIFVNYDCDVDAPNIFERTVNGLLKTALGPPPGSATTLSPAHDLTFRLESVKCLVRIIKSMGLWMDQQLKIGDFFPPSTSSDDESRGGDDSNLSDFDLQAEAAELSDAATLEQRRAYKLEVQKGVSLFNKKPSKGIDFLIRNKRISGSPEAVVEFLKNTSSLNEAMIGDYLGEREEFSLKVMHAYVDSFNFGGMDFGEAIRFFLRGFRLPGEAQKIDRIMEKFAERYCKCNPTSFTSADTAYVLAYSVIMLNTDAHNTMVKDKMTKADFIRNNRGIDDGKDLAEEYLGDLYDQIVRDEIKMKADLSVPQSKQSNNLNRLLGLDGILNFVWKQTEEKPLGANGVLIRHIQEQFKAKSGKSESIYYCVTDPAILRFMIEVCWGPMLAAFSVTLDQSDDKAATSQSLQGIRHAVHVTAVMGMQTQRDAFVTTVAKFTYLHCAADIKQKNVDAVKAIISIAIEDGNYLQEAWEHILTCLSRFEHLQLLGEGAPSDASFFTTQNGETDEKSPKSSLRKKGTLQDPAVMAVVRGGSYDSTSRKVNMSGLVTPEQISNFISNLNLLDQVGSFELNHIFAHSQRLKSEAIVAFVKALCKVSMSELQSPTDPRVFSLTKIVEVAHYNMNRIRLVWSRIWSVLSDFFVSVGLSENLSVAIFVMDSLRQLAMKFLEREELANYNFQNEFLMPFVIIMQKSSSAEIRELIVRCISQMVLTRVNNVKSGWKSVFLVFTAAAADERKNIVLLAFQTMERVVREYFPHITEVEALTFRDCVKCLIAFTSSRFNSDVSLNAIAFLRFCAVKLADGGLTFIDQDDDDSSVHEVDGDATDGQIVTNKDDNASLWIPLLTGLSRLTSDPRSAIRKSALEVLFNILKDHGHLFSRQFWISIFNTVIYPVFESASDYKESHVQDQSLPSSGSPLPQSQPWDSETVAVAAHCLVDIFVSFYTVVRSQLLGLVSILAIFITSTVKGYASTGVGALMRLVKDLGSRLSEDEWNDILLALNKTAVSTFPGIKRLIRTLDNTEMPDDAKVHLNNSRLSSNNGFNNDDSEDDNLQTAGYIISRIKSHVAALLLILQVITDIYKLHQRYLSASNVKILLDTFSCIASHAHQLNCETTLQLKLQRACSILEISDPPIVHFENESYENYLNFVQDLLPSNPSLSKEMNIEQLLVSVCETVVQMYLNCASSESASEKPIRSPVVHWILPLGSARKEELAARTSLLLSALRILNGMERDSFRRYVSVIFPLLVDLVRSEHSSGEVQTVLSSIFRSCIGPILMNS